MPFLTDNQHARLDKLKLLVQVAREVFQTQQCVIAGGAPRDILSDKPIKDVDIFLNLESLPWRDTHACTSRDQFFESACREFATRIEDTEVVSIEFNDPQPEYEVGLDICDIETTHGPLQLIGLYDRNPIEDIVNFDFGLSKVYVDCTGVFMTVDAMLDRHNKTITYTPTKWADEKAAKRSYHRLQRLRAKYPDWTFVGTVGLEFLYGGISEEDVA